MGEVATSGIRESLVMKWKDISFLPKNSRIPILNLEQKQVGEIPSPENVLRITHRVTGQGEKQMYAIIYAHRLYEYDQSTKEFRESKTYGINYNLKRYYLRNQNGEMENVPIALGEKESQIWKKQQGVLKRIKALGGQAINTSFEVSLGDDTLKFELPETKESDLEWLKDDFVYKGTVKYKNKSIGFRILPKYPYTLTYDGEDGENKKTVEAIKDVLGMKGIDMKELSQEDREQVEKYIQYIKKYFHRDQWENAIKVMKAESGFHADAFRPAYKNPGGGDDCGLFQINTKHQKDILKGMRLQKNDLFDPEKNIKVASKIYNQSKGWSPWVAAQKMGLDRLPYNAS